MIAERGSSVLVEHLHRRADVRGIPLSGTFELTPMCSMSCKMCYVRMTPEEVRASGKRLRTVEEWLSFGSSIGNFGKWASSYPSTPTPRSSTRRP